MFFLVLLVSRFKNRLLILETTLHNAGSSLGFNIFLKREGD